MNLPGTTVVNLCLDVCKFTKNCLTPILDIIAEITVIEDFFNVF